MTIASDVLATAGLQPVVTTGRFAAFGTIKRNSTTETDAAMQGLITARLRFHLRVVDTSTGGVVASLDTDARGGGFTAEDAEAQATQRIGEKIRSMLKLRVNQERQ